MIKHIKQNFTIILIFLAAYLALCFTIYNKTRDYAIYESEKKIENLLLMHKAIHGYIEEVQKPVFYQLKKDGKLYNEFFMPEVLSFTFIARGIKDEYNKQRVKINQEPIYFKLASDNPRNPINEADEKELAVLNQINEKKITDIKEVIEEKGQKFLYVALPVQANKASCMQCHSTPDIAPKELVQRYGEKAGFYEDINKTRAIISIKAPLKDELKDANKLFIILSLSAFILMFCVLLMVIYFVAKLKRKEDVINNQNEELFKLNSVLEEKIKLESEKLVEKELMLMQQSKMAAMGEMIGAIAHQWKQPISSIAILTQDLRLTYELDGKIDDEHIMTYTDHITKIVADMVSTIDDFRNFFTPNSMSETFYIENTIDEVLIILKSQLSIQKIQILFDNTTQHQYTCQKNKLKHVLLNILANAKDVLSTDNIDNKFIKIQVSQDSNFIKIEIEDSGGGIEENIIEHIFEPYFTTKDKNGTGIGLYMSKEIVDNHLSGRLNVANSINGAIFTIELPN